MKHFILLGIALSIISCGRISNTQQLQRMYGKEIEKDSATAGSFMFSGVNSFLW